MRIRIEASGKVTLWPLSSPKRNSSRRKLFTCSVNLLHFFALRAQPRSTLLELSAVEVLEVLWLSGIFAFRGALRRPLPSDVILLLLLGKFVLVLAEVETADKVVVRAVNFSTPFLRA